MKKKHAVIAVASVLVLLLILFGSNLSINKQFEDRIELVDSILSYSEERIGMIYEDWQSGILSSEEAGSFFEAEVREINNAEEIIRDAEELDKKVFWNMKVIDESILDNQRQRIESDRESLEELKMMVRINFQFF